MEEQAKIVKDLLELNVNDHTESKNGLRYLSWAWACTEAIKQDPDFSYEVQMFDGKPYVYDENLGYMVFTTVTLGGMQKSMQLPVMDSSNQAQKNIRYSYKVKEYVNNKWTGEYKDKWVEPATMFDINTAIMRCLAKNLALFGLGMYIYAGEDLPEELEDPVNPLTPEQKAAKKAKEAEDYKKQAIISNRER